MRSNCASLIRSTLPHRATLAVLLILHLSPTQVALSNSSLRAATTPADEQPRPPAAAAAATTATAATASLASLSRPALVQLDTGSFELVADAYDFETKTYFILEERYSGQQRRGRVRLTTRSADVEPARHEIERTQVYLVDSELDSTVRRDELTDECHTSDWNSVLAQLGFDLIEFESNVSGHLFGAARLLRYFTVHRSQLRADVSGKNHFSRSGQQSLRYERRFVRERRNGTGQLEPQVLEVSVFYTKASLAGAADWTHALPTRIQCEYPHEQRKGLLLEFGPLKFIEPDDLGGVAAGDQPEVPLLDGLTMAPASGCSRAISKRLKWPWTEMEGARQRRTDSFSFWAKGRHLTANFASYFASRFQARVAYDVWLNKLRVDTHSDSLGATIQILDFALDKATHILPQPDSGSVFLSDFLDESNNQNEAGQKSRSRPQPNRPTPQPGELLLQPRTRAPAGGEAKRMFKCVNGEVNSSPLTAPIMTLDNLLMGGSKDYAYLGLARVRGIRARVFETIDSQLPFWLDPQIHTAASVNRFASAQQTKRQLTTVIYLSEPSRETNDTRLLLMEIYETDPELRTTINKREISVFDFSWSLQAMGSSEQSGGQLAMSLFSPLELCSEWLPGADQEANESHAHFRMILHSDKQVAGSMLAWIRDNPSVLQLSLLNKIQLELHLVLGLVYDFETRLLEAGNRWNDGGVDESNHSQTLQLMVQFNVGRLPQRLHKMMFLGRGRRVANKSWFIRTLSLQECFMLASHRQVEVEFAHDPSSSFCYIATQARRSNATLDPKDVGPFQIDPRAALNVFKTLKVPDYHKSTREWWLSEPELSSRRRRGLLLDFIDRNERIKLRIDHIRVNEHKPHLLYGSSLLVDKAGVLLGVGLSQEDELNWCAAHFEPNREQTTFEQRLTSGQCQSLCQADFSCRACSFCLRGIKAECVLSRANLNDPMILSEVRLFLLNKTTSIRQFKLAPDQSVSLRKSQNCATYNKQYLNYYAESASEISLEQVFYQRALPAAELEQCAELCFRQLLESDHHKAMNKFGHDRSGPGYDIFARRRERAELDNDNAEGCSKFYFVDHVTGEEAKDLGASLGFSSELSQNLQGVCMMVASISSPGLELKSAKLNPDKVVSYGFKFSSLYDEHYQVSLRGSQMGDLERGAIQNVVGAGLERQAPDVESAKVVEQLLNRGDNLQMMTFVDKETCARFCYTQSAGLWPYCSSFDVIVSHMADTGPRIRCILNSSSKWRLLAKGREDLIDSNHWTGKNSSEERWHYEIKDGFAGRRQMHWLEAEDESEGQVQMESLSPGRETLRPIKRILAFYLAMSIGVLLGIMLMELRADTKRPRRGSVSSQLELVMT